MLLIPLAAVCGASFCVQQSSHSFNDTFFNDSLDNVDCNKATFKK